VAELNVQKITQDGITPSFSSAEAGGDTFDNNGRTFLHVNNGGAAQITVTIASKKPCNQGFTHDLTVDIPASEERQIGPFEADRFNNTEGEVEVSYSDVSSVQVAAVAV